MRPKALIAFAREFYFNGNAASPQEWNAFNASITSLCQYLQRVRTRNILTQIVISVEFAQIRQILVGLPIARRGPIDENTSFSDIR